MNENRMLKRNNKILRQVNEEQARRTTENEYNTQNENDDD